MKTARLSDRGGPNRKLRVLCEMLSCRPWSRYPLTLRFFVPDATQLLYGCRPLPPHVRTAHDTIDTLSVVDGDASDNDSDLDEGWAEASRSVADGLLQAGARQARAFLHYVRHPVSIVAVGVQYPTSTVLLLAADVLRM